MDPYDKEKKEKQKSDVDFAQSDHDPLVLFLFF